MATQQKQSKRISGIRSNNGLRVAMLTLIYVILGVAIGLSAFVAIDNPSDMSTSTQSVTTPGSASPAASGSPAPTGATATPAAQSTASGASPTSASSAFDVPHYSTYLTIIVIWIVTGLLEMFLVILYAAFFVNDPKNANLPLGLPVATVRVFLIVVVVLTIILFALWPDLWGSNKAVVLLFGLLSTVIGFYFGSRATADATDTSVTPVKLTLDPDSKKPNPDTKPFTLKGSLASNYATVLGTNPPQLNSVIQDAAGDDIANGDSVGVIDSDGKVEFAFKGGLPLAYSTSYLLHIEYPPMVKCDDRFVTTPTTTTTTTTPPPTTTTTTPSPTTTSTPLPTTTTTTTTTPPPTTTAPLPSTTTPAPRE